MARVWQVEGFSLRDMQTHQLEDTFFLLSENLKEKKKSTKNCAKPSSGFKNAIL